VQFHPKETDLELRYKAVLVLLYREFTITLLSTAGSSLISPLQPESS